MAIHRETYPTREERISLCQEAVTLDGQKAKVVGYGCEFATVTTMDGRQRVEFAWQTVRRVVQHSHGAFKS